MFKIILSRGPSEESNVFVTNTDDLYFIIDIVEKQGFIEYKIFNKGNKPLDPADFNWTQPFRYWVTKFYYEK